MLVRLDCSTHFIPALNSGAKGATADECVQDPRLVPFVTFLGIFQGQCCSFFLPQLQAIVPDVPKGFAVLSEESAFSDMFCIYFVDFGLLHESVNQIIHFLMGLADEGVHEFLRNVSQIAITLRVVRRTLLMLSDAASASSSRS